MKFRPDLEQLRNPDLAAETYKLWEKDVFELYLGANFENINLYGEFQISPQG